jgi:hypothetical protein
MKLNLEIQVLVVAFSIVTTIVSQSEGKDPFSEASRTPPVYDSAYFAEKAKEQADRWSAFLTKIKQPELKALKANPAIEIYRFTYRPHFGKAIILTAMEAEDKLSFEIRRLSEKDVIELSGSIEMDAHTFDGIRRVFEKPETYDPLRELTLMQRSALWGLDGSWWHLETLRNGDYTHAVVWSPNSISSATKEERASFRSQFEFDLPDLQPFESACLELVKLSGLPLDAKYYEPRPEPQR